VLADMSCQSYTFSCSCIPYNTHVSLEETPGWSFE